MSAINVPVRAELDADSQVMSSAELILAMCDHCFAMVPESKLDDHYRVMRHGL